MINKELTVFRRVNEAISHAPDVEAVAGALLDIVIDETSAENASIMMPSRDGSRLEIKAAKGVGDRRFRYSEDSLGNAFPMGTGIAGRVAQTRKAIVIPDASKDSLFQSLAMKIQVGSLLSMPLVYGKKELVGVLNLSHPRARGFGKRDMDLVKALLPPAALALRNARTMREMGDINAILKADLSMTDQAVDEFGRNIFRIFTCMSMGVLTSDLDGRITAANRQASGLLGLVSGDSIASLLGEDVLLDLKSETREMALDVERGGRVLNLEIATLPMKPSRQILVCVRDVTLERFKERELVRIKDQYKDMVENALDAMYIIKGGRFLLTNRKFQEMLGYGQDEITGRHFRRFITRDTLAALKNSLRHQTGNVFVPNLEIQSRRKDGQILYLEISIGRLVIDGENCYIGVVRDITSKKELLALKTRFLHVASHEIRVPLTVIRGYARMLSREAHTCLSPGQRENVQEIEDQCEKLLHFSNSLLDFAKINAETLTLHRQTVGSSDYLGAIARNMAVGIRDSRVKVALHGCESVPELYVDPIRFEQAVCNLIHNAIKHSPEEGTVTVSLERGIPDLNAMNKLLNRECAVITVLDEGPGIRAEEARELFSDFYVGISGRAKGGIGLGLSITREIVHAHGGSVEARPSDSGGCFVITIPLNSEDD